MIKETKINICGSFEEIVKDIKNDTCRLYFNCKDRKVYYYNEDNHVIFPFGIDNYINLSVDMFMNSYELAYQNYIQKIHKNRI